MSYGTANNNDASVYGFDLWLVPLLSGQNPHGSKINPSGNHAFKPPELILNYTFVIRHTFESAK